MESTLRWHVSPCEAVLKGSSRGVNNPKVAQHSCRVVGLGAGRALRAFWSSWVGWDPLVVLTQGEGGGGYLGGPAPVDTQGRGW